MNFLLSFFLKKKDITKTFSGDFENFGILFVNFPNKHKFNADFKKFNQIENFKFFSCKPKSMKPNKNIWTKPRLKFDSKNLLASVLTTIDTKN